MSTTNPAPAPMAMPGWPTPAQTAGHLAAIAAHMVASAIVRRAARRAHRELAALDDRTLADIGLARDDLMTLLAALAETRVAAALSQLPWNRPRMGA